MPAGWVDQALRTALRAIPPTWKTRVKHSLGIPSMERGLLRLRTAGFTPDVAIDVGAYHGDWTQLCKHVFPDTRVLMIEAQPHLYDKLLDVAGQLTGVVARTALLGAQPAERVPFLLSETGSRVAAVAEAPAEPVLTLPMTTLEDVAVDTGFSRAQLLKLDVQGHELEVLRGAGRLLDTVEVVIMEVSLIPILPQAPLFDEVTAYMSDQDFRLYDVCGFIERPLDRALWQMDVVFVRSRSRLLASSSWA